MKLNRNLRYGGTATLFTVAFLVLLIALNTAFSTLCDKLGWYVDMTEEMAFTLSDSTKNLLRDVNSDIRIIFCDERDKVEASQSMYYVHHTAQELAWEYDNIKLDYINVFKDPDLVRAYRKTPTTQINANSVIVVSGGEYKLFTVRDFFTFDNTSGDLFAYNGEQTFVAGILAITADEAPIAYFTTGHGESATESFYRVLANAGFDVRTIDLTREEIDPGARLIIINDPHWDFSESQDGDGNITSELEKIDKFLSEYGSLMVFVDPGTDELKNLEEYLYSWGVVFGDGVVRDMAHSISVDGYSVVGQYGTGTYVESLYQDISSLASAPKTIVRYASPITYPRIYLEGIEEDGTPSGTYTYTGNNSTRYIAPLLVSSSEAQVWRDGEVLSDGGSYNLMTLTCDSRIVNGTYLNSYVLAAGTTAFTSPDFINSNVYANEDILYVAMRAMGAEVAPIDIPFKPLVKTAIEDMTTAQANTWTVCTVTILPVLTLLAGLFVCIRRKYQ